jgi:ATP-dependent helicase/nuclease subunit A
MAATDAGLPPLKGNQRSASDPRAHVWLSASAGTGKTQVLAARVYRLLLRGVAPSAILCLTFTKAGAAEMAGRIGERLARWVRLSDAELAGDLEALGERGDAAMRDRARTLFASVLDAPGGGIRIQTIHAFCQSLLAAFPAEAGLAPGFRPLEEREEALLAREALAAMLLEEEAHGRRGIVEAIGALSVRLGEGGAEDFLRACARAPDAMSALPTGLQPFLRRALDLPSGDIAAELERRCGCFDDEALRDIIARNRSWGTNRGLSRADALDAWLVLDGRGRAAALTSIGSSWSTAKGWAPQGDGYAELVQPFVDECQALASLAERASYADCLAGALEAGRAYAAAYMEAKRRAGAVDFDDLIRATVSLLQRPGMGDWVRFKLDQATDHVLIDEAQDTNPEQWAIVRALADEFFAGEGARADVQRTLFTVGDYKQAIFGFQGTSPAYFAAAHAHFDRASKVRPEFIADARALDTLSLTHSFRSTRPVLEFVDAAISALPAPGMGALSDVEEHASEVRGPGTVTLWPAVSAGPDAADEESWIDDATRRLASDLARWVKRAMGTLPLESKGRLLRPEDVMILVKRRGALASLLVARLYAEGVPVAGVDRLRLNAPLAVQDLLAAVRFVLQPDDSLSLANLLVSPLIGWTQDELMRAALRDRRVSLWQHLRRNQPSERLAPMLDMLARADFVTPHRFLEELLSGPLQGRRKLLERLGEEARDPIEELLTAALTFETSATPSLQRFLDWFDRGEVEIKRDPSTPHDAVRVMTAHGAKGLQSPLVILADATADPADAPRSLLKWSPDEHHLPIPIFRPRASERAGSPLDQVVAEAEAADLEEHWRLFYVAATRAEERLVIAGALSERRKGVPPPTSWYAAAARALDALNVPAGEGERVFTGRVPQAPIAARRRTAPAEPVAVSLPAWLRAPAPQEARPPRPLAPSSIGEDDTPDPPPSAAMRDAAERGRLLHALFERLPDVELSRRPAVADRWLEMSCGVADPSRREEITRAALAIIDDPQHGELFGPGALAEAPITAVVDGTVIAGTVDRLIVGPDRILVVDFKTGRRAPAIASDIPPTHLRQMAAYAAALRVIFPDRLVEAALLYTAGPRLFVLTPADLADHKPDFARTEQS